MSGTRLQESPGGSTKDDSDELDFRWQANPALAKGVILLLIGGFILVAPEIAAPVLRFLFGIGLVLFGYFFKVFHIGNQFRGNIFTFTDKLKKDF